MDDPTAADNQDQSSPTSTPPNQKRSHKRRKSSDARLRKLFRRATATPQGITSRAEWEELIDLHSDWASRNSSGENSDQAKDKYAAALPGPSISIRGELNRDFRNIGEWQSSKVADHRDILANLLFGGESNGSGGAAAAPSKKKRKKQKPEDHITEANDVNKSYQQTVHIPPLPSWANISNLASMGGVAVIEIDINDSGKDTCSLMPSEFLRQPNTVWETMHYNYTAPDTNDNKQQVRRVIGAACKVKMFQGDYPRCISDELMFLPPPSPLKLNASKSDGNTSDLFKALYNLRLTPKQMQLEGFPRRTTDRVQIDKSSEMHSNAQRAREKLSARATSFWDIYASGQELEIVAKTPKNGNDAIELVEALQVRETVCCMEEDNDSNNDEFSKLEFYVETFTHDKQRHPKVFAMDCEMVHTSAGPELARVSVLMLVPDNNGWYSLDETKEETNVVLDELVKPRRHILDYLTEYSGITPVMLQEVDTRIEDIQAHLLSLIQETDIIVGHSLENDLKALRLMHLNVVDTSVIFRGGSGRKYGLRHLTNILLKKQIQTNIDGHCSTEDAEAALILAVRRARLGPSFQLKENARGKNIMRTFQTINREAGDNVKSLAERNKGPCVCIGNNDWITKYARSDGSHHVLSCDSIMNSMSMAIPSWLSSSTNGRRAGFLWANLACGDEDTCSKVNAMNKLEEIVREMNRRVPFHTPILMIFQRNYKQALALTKQRKLALKSTAIQWTADQEATWQKIMDSCVDCEATWIVGTFTSKG